MQLEIRLLQSSLHKKEKKKTTTVKVKLKDTTIVEELNGGVASYQIAVVSVPALKLL